jgi:cytochrome c6
VNGRFGGRCLLSVLGSNNKRGGKMKKFFALGVSIISLYVFATACYGKEPGKGDQGEALFKQHCAVCHPDGGNIINPQKTLHKKDLEANNIKKPRDIINKMRNPGSGMTKFDEKSIPGTDAKIIAEYILKTFK